MKKILTPVVFCFATLTLVGCSTEVRTLLVDQPGREGRNGSDPLDLFLEEVEGARALEWVREKNEATFARLKTDARYQGMEDAALELLNASDRIPFPSIVGDYVYNFWQDANHTRGIYRRTTIESYRTENPAWELVLDVDALAAAERENWVFKGLEVLAHSNRAMVSLSRGGTDATVYREFDLETKQFVENGFVVPEAKTTLTWLDEDRLIVGTDFGGDSLTDSGYARVLKIWTRGTSLGQAETVFEAERQDVWTYATVLRHEGNSRVVFVRALSFFTAHSFTVIFFRDS